MDQTALTKLLKQVSTRKRSIPAALKRLQGMPFEDIGFAKIDHHRGLRQGFPEVVFCEGKTIYQITAIVKRLTSRNPTVLATRADKKVWLALKKTSLKSKLVYHPAARLLLIGKPQPVSGKGTIAVVCAGTADIPVAEEAALTAEAMGNQVQRIYDTGVAGLHRLLAHREDLYTAQVLIVVAGMEGALASVVGGLVSRPIVAVPTSIGYGASFKGLAALLAMMTSCSPNVAVVNINNGFGAGFYASLINRSK